MDPEALIMERLKKLREWQIEQQDRLIKEQQLQRKLLTDKQDCIYKALELSLQELNLDEDIVHKDDVSDTEVSHNILSNDSITSHNSFNRSEAEEKSIAVCNAVNKDLDYLQSPDKHIKGNKRGLNTPTNPNTMNQSAENCEIKNPNTPELIFHKQRGSHCLGSVSSKIEGEQSSHLLMEGVTPLPMDNIPIKPMLIDDVPVPSPKKDFHTLLEERLKDYQDTTTTKNNQNEKVRVKRPFLKKGEGLSRFRINRDKELGKSRPRSSSLSASMKLNSKGEKGQNSKINQDGSMAKKSQPQNSKLNIHPVQQRLSLKNVPLPAKKVRSKSESASTCIKSNILPGEKVTKPELNASDYQTKTQKEKEEVRIFELLEEKAENSSFCSTSSAVLAFLQQSTPFKIKNKVPIVGLSRTNIRQNQSPIIKRSIVQQQQSQVQACMTGTEINNSYWQSRLSNKGNDDHSYYSVNDSVVECSGQKNHTDTELTRAITRTDCSKEYYNSSTACNLSDSITSNEVDVSLHVRFSEYNEYKTIGLTDTSTISNDSTARPDLIDDQTWDNATTPNDSDTDTSYRVEKGIELCKSTRDNTINTIDRIDDVFVHNFKTFQYENVEIESDVTDRFSSPEPNSVENFDNRYHKCEGENSKGRDTNINHKDASQDTNMDVEEFRIETGGSKSTIQNSKETIFTSELLKNRLLELENEIDIFRKENATLSQQRRRLQEDQQKFYKELANREKIIKENQIHAENQLQEEKKKLMREKTALENRLRDAQEKAQQNKLERQEIQSLKEELNRLRDEIGLKESRWNAAQSRQKCQVRILKMENAKLRGEIEQLQNSKKNNVKNKMRASNISNTRAIHRINKQLNMENKQAEKIIGDSSSDGEQKQTDYKQERELVKETTRNCKSATLAQTKDSDSETEETLKKSQPNMDIAKKRALYERLLKEATLDITDIKDSNISENINLQECKAKEAENVREESKIEIHCPNVRECFHDTVQESNSQDQKDGSNISTMKDLQQELAKSSTSPGRLSNMSHMKNMSSPYNNCGNNGKQDVREVRHPDGRVELWYPNGNVKKIFPEQGITKMIYYNGDVRETNKDGRIKYFYASTRTWHTTMPDGLEILEFPDGQVEKRTQNGIVEVRFPDGSKRILQSDGSEKWTLSDGTIVETFLDGEKVLSLPNGQREVHTKDHKRREYPDGTVKLVYTDGTQETRYSNGRIRLKDKDGNLLMDAYQ